MIFLLLYIINLLYINLIGEVSSYAKKKKEIKDKRKRIIKIS